MNRMAATFEDVKTAVIVTLGIEDRADALSPTTPLVGGLPELDSLAIVQLILELERRFGLVIEDEEITADVFATLGSLAGFVEDKLR